MQHAFRDFFRFSRNFEVNLTTIQMFPNDGRP